MSANKPKTTGEGSGTGDGKMADENMELDERKVKILDAVIRNYLATGEPVGSRTISKYTDLNLSSATIRNEMADLEELGYIVQPHTSSYFAAMFFNKVVLPVCLAPKSKITLPLNKLSEIIFSKNRKIKL